ncbi:MAG: bile acid:sodium symporter [Paludibacteraceae bacterium]
MNVIAFVKKWTLPIAMITGAIGYFVLAKLPLFAPAKPAINEVITILTPTLIFAQLLLSFCKIDPKTLRPHGWHGWLLIFQAATCCMMAALLLWLPISDSYRAVFEGIMVCLVCPTATAGVVITGKLGGNTSSLLTYTLLSNIMAAILVPLIFPLVEPHAGLTFIAAFFRILGKVFPLLLAPFLLALLFRYCLPRLHQLLLRYSWLAFYLWAVSLTIVTGQTVQSLVTSSADLWTEMLIALGGLVACVLQFWIGKKVGTVYNDRISAGQSLGQKNTILAIWMAYSYLNPLASVGPGSYVIWQNSFNSWQLWKQAKTTPSKK